MRVFVLVFGFLWLLNSLLLSVARLAEPQPAYISFAHNSTLFKVRPDGSHLQQITFGYHEDGAHAWSQDGKWIAFTSYREGGQSLYKMRPTGKSIQRLTYEISTTPSWYKNWIFFEGRTQGNWQVHKMNADGKANPIRLTEASDGAASPAVSPDGKWIVFVTNPLNDEPLLYLMSADGSTYRQLNVPTSSAYLPDWSPDSQNLIISVNQRSILGTLYQVTISDDEISGKPLPTPLDGQANLIFPTWSPDGQWIAFIGMKSGTAYLYKIRADGTDLQRVTDIDSNIWYPRWSPIVEMKWRFLYSAIGSFGLLLLLSMWSKLSGI